MNSKSIDKAILAIVEKKKQLNQLDYNDSKYDKLEEELHDLEDKFMDEFGDELEEVLQDVHDEHCPDNDVLLPIAYLANSYLKTSDGYDIEGDQGVFVEAESLPGNNTKMVIVPSPLRILLVNSKVKKEVWKAE